MNAQEYRVLNVGGSSKEIPLPPHYEGWEHILVDIDPRGNPDIVCDVRRLKELPGNQYDAVYCAHNLEHYYRHDLSPVLEGFRYVLKETGFVEIIVPDMDAVMRNVIEEKKDIDDVLYHSKAGPITIQDVIYGYGKEIERSGNDFYAHKTGFTERSLLLLLERGGFSFVLVGTGNYEIRAIGFIQEPDERHKNLLGISLS